VLPDLLILSVTVPLAGTPFSPVDHEVHEEPVHTP
jgi:hypothetical protein